MQKMQKVKTFTAGFAEGREGAIASLDCQVAAFFELSPVAIHSVHDAVQPGIAGGDPWLERIVVFSETI
ncbi:hypothetical protein KKG36_01945 [Patescibacteria group bacterium]|nr:hypothetical protein [Patescibacteria group bacterium]